MTSGLGLETRTPVLAPCSLDLKLACQHGYFVTCFTHTDLSSLLSSLSFLPSKPPSGLSLGALSSTKPVQTSRWTKWPLTFTPGLLGDAGCRVDLCRALILEAPRGQAGSGPSHLCVPRTEDPPQCVLGNYLNCPLKPS